MRQISVIICLILCLCGLSLPARADLAVGQRFADLTFSGTISAADRAYLGLNRTGPFTLKDLKSQYVLLEFLSDSCVHCILQVPFANRLFRLLASHPQIKMLGLGFYCTPVQLERWRDRHQVAIPLIPDPRAELSHTLDIPGTPTYVLLDRQGRVLFMHAGEMGSPQQFLHQILSHLDF
jgi:peroxiredoxin